jgi:DNA-binding CsgD family transcriptional regulator
MEITDGLVTHETQYFADPFAAPPERDALAQPIPPRDQEADPAVGSVEDIDRILPEPDGCERLSRPQQVATADKLRARRQPWAIRGMLVRVDAWLTTVAVREAVCVDRRDRRDRRLVCGQDLPGRCHSLSHAEAFAALEVVASLPPRQRELIRLQVAGYSRQEIAVLTGTSHRAVERHLRRARATLRDS